MHHHHHDDEECECGHHHHDDEECECGHHHHDHDADEVFTSYGFETTHKYSHDELEAILHELSLVKNMVSFYVLRELLLVLMDGIILIWFLKRQM